MAKSRLKLNSNTTAAEVAKQINYVYSDECMFISHFTFQISHFTTQLN